MQQIRNFGVFQTAKVVAVLYFLGMAVVAILLIPFLLIVRSTSPESMPFGGGGSLGFLIFVFLMPPLYAVIAFITTAIGCAIYNIVAQWVGGIEVELRPSAG